MNKLFDYQDGWERIITYGYKGGRVEIYYKDETKGAGYLAEYKDKQICVNSVVLHGNPITYVQTIATNAEESVEKLISEKYKHEKNIL